MHHHHHHNTATKKIAVAFLLNALFVVIEIVGGILTNSIAILSDALHDTGDCLSLGIAWGLQKKSAHPRDAHYSYGYKRFSLLGSIFLSGVLVVSSVFVIYEAVRRIVSVQPVEAKGMLWMAVIGIAINGVAALTLKRGDSLNERAAFLHIMEDVLGWVAVLIASVVMLFVEWPILDPILSLCISIWVLYNVFSNLKDTFRVLLQAIPEGVDVQQLTAEIEAIAEVSSIHDLHIWTLDGNDHVMTLHVVSDADILTLKPLILAVAERYHIHHTTIEVEPNGYCCTDSCD